MIDTDTAGRLRRLGGRAGTLTVEEAIDLGRLLESYAFDADPSRPARAVAFEVAFTASGPRCGICDVPATRRVVRERSLPHHHSIVYACDQHADRIAERALLDFYTDRVVTEPIGGDR